MNIIATDDEHIALMSLIRTISEALPFARVQGFSSGSDTLNFAQKHPCDIAFLDIRMQSMDGITLAKQLKVINPKINIIFVTGYAEHTGEALSLYVSGYVLKPATKEKILMEIEQLRHPTFLVPQHRMQVQTFGNFEVFVNDQLLHFSSAKSKELFAILIDRQGAGISTPEIAAVLWEDEPYSIYQKNRVQQAISALRTVLKKSGCKDVLYKQRNQTAVNTNTFFCDYYLFLKGDLQSINSFKGEYMAQYSWAEFTTAFLHKRLK